MEHTTLTRRPRKRRLRTNGTSYHLKLNACTKCASGALHIQERVLHGQITDTEANCLNCGTTYYGRELRPATPIV